LIADAKDMPRALVEVMHDLTWKSEGVSESLIARVHLNGRLQENPDVEILSRTPIPCTRSTPRKVNGAVVQIRTFSSKSQRGWLINVVLREIFRPILSRQARSKRFVASFKVIFCTRTAVTHAKKKKTLAMSEAGYVM